MPLVDEHWTKAATINVIPNDRDDPGGQFLKKSSSRSWMQKKLAMLQLRLELDGDLTRFQPPQVSVVNNEDGTLRCLLLTSAELFYRHQAIMASGCFGADSSPLPCDILRGKDFRISERYRCVADRKGQAQGGVGFIFEGLDMIDRTKVAVKFFHKTSDPAATVRTNMELVTCLRLYHGLNSSTCIDGHDELDMCHLVRLRDILVDAPVFEERGIGGGEGGAELDPSVFRATAMVFDWADGGDADSLVRATHGGIAPADGARLFREVLRGVRALHRRSIVHRDIKPENILLSRDGQPARLCDFGFAKHVPSVQPADLEGDPTTCYQSPQRWQACPTHSAAGARRNMTTEAAAMNNDDNNSANCGNDTGVECGVPRRDESAASLFASDVFSAGVTLFVLVSYHAILTRLMTEAACRDVGEAEASSLPALNVFQRKAGGDMFGLLQAGVRKGGMQRRLWAYWEAYGLELPSALRGLLDGVLHPLP
ncbi:unnamed protein product, partial [Hapterophycus canaliculatus]